MRRLTTWLLILALLLLALCVVWLLPRLLREDPPPEQNIAAGAQGTSVFPGQVPPTDDADTPSPSPAQAAAAEGSVAKIPGQERPAADPANAPATLIGRVLDRGGRSVPGILVLAAHAPDLGAPVGESEAWISRLPLDVADPKSLGAEVPSRVTTDELGTFRIEGLEPGRVRLAVRSPRHAPLDRGDLRIGSGQVLSLGDLVLEPPCFVDGFLFDTDDAPVGNVLLVASDVLADATLPPLAAERGVRLAQTEVRGRFRAGPLGPGPCRLHALGRDHAPGREDVEAVAFDLSDACAGGEYTVTMPVAVRISGQVLVRGGRSLDLLVRALPADTARGPVPFEVRGDARSSPVRPDGSFEIEGLSDGVLYELRAGAALARFEATGPWNPPVFATAPDEHVRLRWNADAGIAFDLVDERDRASVGACRVDFEQALPEEVVLGRSGPRELEGVRPIVPFRKVHFRIASRGFEPLAQAAEIEPGATSSLGMLAMKPTPRLTVRVLDAATGAPVAGAFARAIETSTGFDASGLDPEPVRTDASGTAVVASYFGSGSRVEVEAPGYARASFAGPFGYGYSDPRLEVELRHGASARIRVVAEDGTPIPGMRVEWVEGNWSPPTGGTTEPFRPIAERPDPRTSRFTDAEGRVAFLHLAPGRHAFHVQRHRASFLDGEWTQRELADEEVQEIELLSRAPSTLEIRITDGGAPLAGAPVCLLRAEDAARAPDLFEIESPLPPGIDARLDARGRATLQEVDAPGLHVLAVFVDGQRRRVCFPIDARADSHRFFVDLSSSAVTGTVLDALRSPVAGAEVFYVDEARVRELKTRARRGLLLDSPVPGGPGIERPVARTDETGRFRILGLPPEVPFALLVRARPDEASAGGVKRTQTMTLERDRGALDVPVTLSPAGGLEILSRSGSESDPCTVVLTSSGEALPRSCRVYPGAAQTLYGLEPGEWDLEVVSQDRHFRDRQRVEIAAADVRTVQIRLP